MAKKKKKKNIFDEEEPATQGSEKRAFHMREVRKARTISMCKLGLYGN